MWMRYCCEQLHIHSKMRATPVETRHGAEQYAGDLECVFYGYHLDRAILKNAEAAYCLMPSLVETHQIRS